MGHQYRYPIPYEQYSYPQQQQQQYQSQMLPAPSQQATNICQLCNCQGHYNYQCQFAGDFMARTQKPSIRADHTATKTLIMGTGHMVTTMTMTLMGNLFSNGGSQCH